MRSKAMMLQTLAILLCALTWTMPTDAFAKAENSYENKGWEYYCTTATSLRRLLSMITFNTQMRFNVQRREDLFRFTSLALRNKTYKETLQHVARKMNLVLDETRIKERIISLRPQPDVAKEKINSIIKRLGADDFEERNKAEEELFKISWSSISYLRKFPQVDMPLEARERLNRNLSIFPIERTPVNWALFTDEALVLPATRKHLADILSKLFKENYTVTRHIHKTIRAAKTRKRRRSIMEAKILRQNFVPLEVGELFMMYPKEVMKIVHERDEAQVFKSILSKQRDLAEMEAKIKTRYLLQRYLKPLHDSLTAEKAPTPKAWAILRQCMQDIHHYQEALAGKKDLPKPYLRYGSMSFRFTNYDPIDLFNTIAIQADAKLIFSPPSLKEEIKIKISGHEEESLITDALHNICGGLDLKCTIDYKSEPPKIIISRVGK